MIIGLPLLHALLASTAAVQVAGGTDIEIVRDLAPRCVTPPYRIEEAPLLEIGSADGLQATDFQAILAARLVPDGLIAIVDLYGHEIRLFDATTGRLVRSIGRSGRGPAEFAAAPSIAVSTEGGIWAWDPGNRRLTHFGLEGEARSEHHFSGGGWGFPAVFTLNAWRVSSGGDVLFTGGGTRISTRTMWAIEAVSLISRDESGLVLIGPRDSTSHVLEDGLWVGDPFKARRSAVIVSDRIHVTQVGAWQIDVYHRRGERIRILRHAIPRTPVTRAIKARARTRLEQFEQPAFLRLFDRLAIEDSTSAIGGVKVSSEGTLWVQRWHSRRMDEDQVFDIVDRAGRWAGTVRLPRGAGELADVTSDRILTVRRDEFDIPYIRLYRLSRSADCFK